MDGDFAGSLAVDRIVLAQFDSAPGQTPSLGHLLRAVMRPAIDLAPDVTPGRHAMCRRVVRVERDRLVEQAQRLVDGLPGPKVQVRHCTKIVVRSEEHTSELQLLMRISSDVFCLKQKKAIQITIPK